MEGIDRVAQPPLLAHFLEQARGHAAAEHVREHLQTVETGIALRQALHAERDMRLFEIASFDARAADEARGLRRRRPRTGETGESPLDVFQHAEGLARA